MTEQEAIDSLVAEFNNDDQGQITNEPNPTPQVTEPSNQITPQPENTTGLPDIKSLLESIGAGQEAINSRLNMIESKVTTPQATETSLTPEQEQLVQAQNELGIVAIKEQVAKQQAFMDEQMAKMELLQAWNDFSKTHPNITQDELVKWAEDNNLKPFLSDVAGWDVLYRAMKLQAQPKATPDAITPTSKGTTENNAFERKKKGEQVSDVELGMELLKGLGQN